MGLLALATAVLFALTASPALAAPPTTFATKGKGASQVRFAVSVAVDQSNGTVYVADRENHRIDEFDSAGNFLLAFGWGVLDGAEELQTCTTTCQGGEFGPDPGEMVPESIAVDPASHDVYVSDIASYRIEKFDHEGHFLLMFGKGVNTGSSGNPDICTNAGPPTDVCGAGSPGTGPGAITELPPGRMFGSPPLSFDASGNVWVGDTDRLERFSPAGAFLSEVKLPGAGAVGALAVDTSGAFYVRSGHPGGGKFVDDVPGVRKYDSSGNPVAGWGVGGVVDEGGHPNALGLDPASGDLFVADQLNPNQNQSETNRVTLLTYDSSGAQLKSFATGQIPGGPQGNALAFGETANRLYVVSEVAQSFTLPPPGPLVTESSEIAKPIGKTTATLSAEVNPEGQVTTFHFQYISQQQFEEDGNSFGAGTQETSESASIGADFTARSASQAIGGLTPITAYRFRVIASNECEPLEHPGLRCKGNSEEGQGSFQTLPPAAIESTFASGVTTTSAILNAEVNPLGDPTSYHFEYLTEADFLANGESFSGPSPATSVPEPDAPLGAGLAALLASQHVQGLAPHTVYRYRLVATNSLAPTGYLGPDRTFTTQTPGALPLPDARAWELVSPPDKHGALIYPIGGSSLSLGAAIQASADGSAMTYVADAPTESAPQGYANGVQVLSARGPDGWQSRDIATLHDAPTGASVTQGEEYRLFSADLSLGVLQPFGPFTASLSPEGSEQTPYLRTDFLGADPTASCTSACYRPLLTGAPGFANVPPGTAFGGCSPSAAPICGSHFFGASPDLSHVVLSSGVALTSTPLPAKQQGLYEWSAPAPPAEALQLLSVLPGGEPTGATIGNTDSAGTGSSARHAVSADGSRVIWTAEGGSMSHLYLRDTTKQETVQLDAVQGGSGEGGVSPNFADASADGSKVFFTDPQLLTADSGALNSKGDLYQCEIAESAGHLSCDLTDLTPESSGKPAVVRGVLGTSDDGSNVYFAADAVLANNQNSEGEEATPGKCQDNPLPGATCNLYLSHDGATTFIAGLAAEAAGAGTSDRPDWSGVLKGLTSRVSPSGRWLAFMSKRPLTGYDNRDAVSGEPDEEVYLYDAQEEKLLCASCNPTGARPHGIQFGSSGSNGTIPNLPLSGGDRVWNDKVWLAANIPTWSPYDGEHALYQSRYLSNSGRLFFNARDALVPQDSNGTGDVYQYEPVGVGNCTTESPSFGPASGGCVDLISSGTSAKESAFLDASETGNDVFFLTTAQLSRRDIDTSLDVYDASADGGEAQPIKPVECSGDACQQPAVPPNDATPGSLTFNGAGNVKEPPKSKKPKKHKKKHHEKKPHKHGGHK